MSSPVAKNTLYSTVLYMSPADNPVPADVDRNGSIFHNAAESEDPVGLVELVGRLQLGRSADFVSRYSAG